MLRAGFKDARDAIRDANATASILGRAQIVAFVRGVNGGFWASYDPVSESVGNAEPDFLCLGTGRIPLPIREHAFDVLCSAIRAEVS